MEIETILPFVLVPVLIAVIAGIAYLAWQMEKKRREALRQVAENLGFSFSPEAAELSSAEFARRHLFTLGRDRRATNLLRGQLDHEEALVFDYRFTTGAGKSRTVHRRTVAAVSLGKRAGLPGFELRPEGILDKIGSALGYQDIDFPEHPGFSKHFLLRGQDESAVREVFDDTVIEAVENLKGICIEGGGAWLVIYRAGRRVKPQRIGDFMEEVRSLRSVFARRAEVRHV
jgi:hypothetical protein